MLFGVAIVLDDGLICRGSLSGEETRLCSSDLTASLSSFIWTFCWGGEAGSSSLEFVGDSGGEIRAPGGMEASVIGGGDCRMLDEVSTP